MNAQPWEPRLGRLEGAYEQVDKRLDSIDHRLDSFRIEVATRFDAVDRRFDALEAKFDGKFAEMSHKIDGGYWRLVSIMITLWVGTMIALVFHHS